MTHTVWCFLVKLTALLGRSLTFALSVLLLLWMLALLGGSLFVLSDPKILARLLTLLYVFVEF